MLRILQNFRLVIIVLLLFTAVLRLWDINNVPVSLFGDELDAGYHAYSILRTARDYSGNLLPLQFQSLAELRAPLYLYSAVPTVAIFGISPLGVRLPAVIFGVLSILSFYLLIKQITNNISLAALSAFLLAVSPWHLHYSRAGFEVTEMLALYLLGIYFFLKSFRSGKYLVLSIICLGLTPWVYNTAKLFLPLTLLVLIIIWKNELRKIPAKYLLMTLTTLLILGVPLIYITLFSGGADRFESISIMNDKTIIPQIGFDRLKDIRMRNTFPISLNQVSLVDKIFHNQPNSLLIILGNNYLKSFSTSFLFINGDPNPRHAAGAEFYAFEFFFLILGLTFFWPKLADNKLKWFFVFWIFTSPFLSALTKDGGNHATRLFYLLPPLVFLIALGVYYSYSLLLPAYKKSFLIIFSGLLLVSFISYQHNYFVHYPWDSERWWHSGFEEAVKTTVSESKSYDKVLISSADEPALIFFLAWSQYPPDKFQEKYPLPKVDIPKLGSFSKLDNYYFGQVGEGSDLYSLGSKLPDRTLYLATFKEINLNLITEPERLPKDLKLIKAVTYPSGAPAFYLLTKND